MKSKSINHSGQFTVSVASEERRQKISKLLEKTKTNKLSTAIWEAIDYYLKEKEN